MEPTLKSRSRFKNRSGHARALLAAALLCSATLHDPVAGALQAQQQPAVQTTVAGKLVGPDGAAAPGLEVRLIPVPSSYLRRLRELGVADAESIVDRTRSDADGRFQLVASRSGPHQIEVLVAGPDTWPPTVVAPVYVRRVLLAESTALPPIQLPEMHDLVVAARDEVGQPVEGALIVVQAAHWSDPELRWRSRKKLTSPFFGRATARTNTDGTARFSLPTAVSSVAVSTSGFNVSTDVPSGNRAEFSLTRANGVTLRILDRDGAPVPRAVIRVGGYQAIPLALTDDRGEATVALAAGKGISYQIEAEDGSFARTSRLANQAPWPARPPVVEVHLWPGFEISGRVVDAKTNQPIEHATLWIDEQPGTPDAPVARAAVARSGAGGEYTLATIADVPPPAIRIAAAGYVTKRVWLGPQHLQAADRRSALRVEMRKHRRPPDR